MEPPQINRNYTPLPTPSKNKSKEPDILDGEAILNSRPPKKRHLFTKLLLLLFVLGLVYAGYYFYPAIKTLSFNSDTFLWQTFTAKKLNYTITYPLTFQFYPNTLPDADILQLYDSQNSLMLNVASNYDVIYGCKYNKICEVKSEEKKNVKGVEMIKTKTIETFTADNLAHSPFEDPKQIEKYYDKPRATIVYTLYHPVTHATISAQLAYETPESDGTLKPISAQDEAIFDKIVSTFTFK